MAQQARAEVDFYDFLGLVTNFDAHDLPPGAAVEQVNAVCIRQAELLVRRGFQQVTFED